IDPAVKARRPRRAAKPAPMPRHSVNRLDLLDEDPPLIVALPAILNDSIKDAPIAVMTRIALDWIIQGTPFDQLFEQAAQDQYTPTLPPAALRPAHALLPVGSSPRDPLAVPGPPAPVDRPVLGLLGKAQSQGVGRPREIRPSGGAALPRVDRPRRGAAARAD